MRYLILPFLLFLSPWAHGASIDVTVDSYAFMTDKSQGTFSVAVGSYSVTSGAIVGVAYVSKFTVGADTVTIGGVVDVVPRLTLPTSNQITAVILNDLNTRRGRGEILVRTNDAIARDTRGILAGVVDGVVGSGISIP